MKSNPMPNEYKLHYQDSPRCVTLACHGVVISVAGPDIFQIALYADVHKVLPEHLVLRSERGAGATYTRQGPVESDPYREIQARAMLSLSTLKGLKKAIESTIEQIEKLSEADNAPSE